MIEEIDKAMDAHNAWRHKLEKAIEDKHIETPIEVITVDNKCAFGQWIYGGNIPDSVKGNPLFAEIIDKHKAFHKEAAIIANLATKGETDEAEMAMGLGSDFDILSKNLYQLLFKLKKEIS